LSTEEESAQSKRQSVADAIAELKVFELTENGTIAFQDGHRSTSPIKFGDLEKEIMTMIENEPEQQLRSPVLSRDSEVVNHEAPTIPSSILHEGATEIIPIPEETKQDNDIQELLLQAQRSVDEFSELIHQQPEETEEVAEEFAEQVEVVQEVPPTLIESIVEANGE
jgi:hypothetical protein